MKGMLIAATLLFAGLVTAIPTTQAAADPPIYCVMAPCGPQDPVPDPQCKPFDQNDGIVHVYLTSDCHLHVDYKQYDCVWNCGWQTKVQGPPVTVRVYGQNPPESSATSAAAELPELPNPCGETAYCTGPECPETSVATTDFFAYLGPHAGVATHSNCTADVTEAGLRCDSATGLLTTGHVDRDVGPVSAYADTCSPDLVCTCDPIEVTAAALPDPFDLICGPTAYCTQPECPAKSVGTSDLLAYMGPHARVTLERDCDVVVSHDPLIVANAAPSLQPPPQCVTSPCCFAPCPPPCYDACDPPGTCQPVAFASPQPLPAGFPAASVTVFADCTADVAESGTPCTSLADPTSDQQTVGPVDLDYENCRLNPDCTCDPMPIELEAASAEIGLPDVCGPTALCQPGELPDLPGPPTFPVCVTEPCDHVVCDEADGRIGVRYEFTSDCRVELSAENVLACPHNWREQELGHAVGPVFASAEVCSPILDCTCPPTSATSAAIEPPVQVEFVVCVEGPCPPRVTCTPKTTHVPGFTVSVSNSCHVTLTQDPLPCEGSRYTTTNYGPVTVRRAYCGPGIEP